MTREEVTTIIDELLREPLRELSERGVGLAAIAGAYGADLGQTEVLLGTVPLRAMPPLFTLALELEECGALEPQFDDDGRRKRPGST